MRDFKEKLFNFAGLENITEDLVLEELFEVAKRVKNSGELEFCGCSICFADVAAIVLNNTKSYYYTNFIDKKKLTGDVEFVKEFKNEIHDKCLEAVRIVHQNPHH